MICEMRVSKSRRTIGAIVTTAAVFCMVSIGSADAENMKVVEGYVSPGALQWPEYVAQAKGWFSKNGVRLEMVTVRGGAAQQLAGGSLDIGYSGFPDFMRATQQGAPIKIIINAVNRPPYAVYAKSSIKSVQDLKGKTVIIGGPKDITMVYTEAMLASAHLKPADIDFIYAKATQDRLAALISGGADAAILYPPSSFDAARSDFTNLGEIDQYLSDFPFTVLATNTNWAAHHQQALIGYMRAYSRAIHWLYDGKNKQEAVKLLVKYGKQNEKDAAETYDYFINKVHAYSTTGRISKGGYDKMTQALISFDELAKPIPPISTFVDSSYVEKAWK